MKAQKKYEPNEEILPETEIKADSDLEADEFAEDENDETREIDIDTDDIVDDDSDNDAIISVLDPKNIPYQFNEATKPDLRSQLENEVERFLQKGGQIEKIPMNKRANPPQKPASNYGRKSI